MIEFNEDISIRWVTPNLKWHHSFVFRSQITDIWGRKNEREHYLLILALKIISIHLDVLLLCNSEIQKDALLPFFFFFFNSSQVTIQKFLCKINFLFFFFFWLCFFFVSLSAKNALILSIPRNPIYNATWSDLGSSKLEIWTRRYIYGDTPAVTNVLTELYKSCRRIRWLYSKVLL